MPRIAAMSGPLTTRFGGAEARRIEEAGLNAMQTQRQLFYDGWLLRVSAGKAKRGRSVNAFFGSTRPLAEKIAHCEGIYAQHGLAPLFRMTPFDQPADLESALVARGYEAFDETFVQARVLERAPELPAHDAGVELASPAAGAFVAAVAELRAATRQQREAHRERLLHSPLGKRFVVVRANGRVACTAQIGVEGEMAGLFDVVTADDARGRGYATLACASLLSWAWQHGAQIAYLQVGAANAPALAVYRKLGFTTAYRYHYRGPPGECG